MVARHPAGSSDDNGPETLGTCVDSSAVVEWTTKTIDFVLVDEVRVVVAVGYDNVMELDCKSDHRGLAMRFHLRESKGRRLKRTRVQRGWKPHLDQAVEPSIYHAALDMALASSTSSTSSPSAGVDINGLVVTAAVPSGRTGQGIHS